VHDSAIPISTLDTISAISPSAAAIAASPAM
jgi:hypothetical protein